jgi:hypothetical protein
MQSAIFSENTLVISYIPEVKKGLSVRIISNILHKLHIQADIVWLNVKIW